VTIRLDQDGFSDRLKYYTGEVVSQSEPFSKTGTYWGYQVRVASSIKGVFEEGPY
jgi:predicted SPOUT superfamily RNA methylase MTH1